MVIFRKAIPLADYIASTRINGSSVGFVPTMGALHSGHLSLIEAAKKRSGLVVCSIFINPTQFTNRDDLARYPVTIERDIELLISGGCDVLFLPSVEEVYPQDNKNKFYDLGNLESLLEGAYRPGHFQGVCKVVDRLLSIVEPDDLYLGQKDYQQCLVIKKLLHITGRKTAVHIVDTKRESSGLAMSSRNMRLNEEQKKKAAVIYEMLRYINENVTGDIPELIHTAEKKLILSGLDVDYVSVVDGDTLLNSEDRNRKLVALIAASLDGVRLIDNEVVNDPSQKT
jgi:pantoate--beta-alanine ligase